jgi:hypothetical protein
MLGYTVLFRDGSTKFTLHLSHVWSLVREYHAPFVYCHHTKRYAKGEDFL